MDYKNSTIGFAASLDSNLPDQDSKPQIGFTAKLSKGFGDTAREPCIGFQAKLREPFVEPQLELAFDTTEAPPKKKAGAPAPAF